MNITEEDLNKALLASFRSNGGPRFEGRRERSSRGMSDISYRLDLENPVLRLQDAGRVSLSLGVRQGDLRIARLERKIGNRLAYCENAGASIDPSHPIDVKLGLHLAVSEQGELRMRIETIEVSDFEGVRLVKPSHCENAYLPTWLLWWLGKSRLKHRLGELDELLLARAHKSASRLERESFLKNRWELGSSDDTNKESLHLYPHSLDTSHGSLFLSMTGSSAGPGEMRPDSFEGLQPRQDRSFVAISGSFLNNVLALSFAQISSRPRTPQKDFDRLLRSSSASALIPGLRGLKSREKLSFSFAFRSPPKVELCTIPTQRPGVCTAASGPKPVAAEQDDQRPVLPVRSHSERDEPAVAEGALLHQPRAAMLRIDFSGIEMSVWQSQGDHDVRLGTLQVDSGRVGVVPYANAVGGVSFDVVENEWRTSSEGIDFDEALLAATIQELAFAEIFETQYEPLWSGGLELGGARWAPSRFGVSGDYLVVELAGSD